MLKQPPSSYTYQRILAQTIAEDSHLRFALRRGLELDVRKSAGPATVALCACPHSYLRELSGLIEKPVNLIGALD